MPSAHGKERIMQGKSIGSGFSPVQIHCTLHLHLTVDHIMLEADFLPSGAGGQEMGQQPGSCPAVGMPWQAGAMPTGTTVATAFLFISVFRTKGQGLTVDSQLLISPGLGRPPSKVLFHPREHGNEGKMLPPEMTLGN